MSKIALVTGAGGFLGSHLVEFLISKNITVYNLGNSKAKNCNHIYLKSISDKEEIKRIFSTTKLDYLFHLAGTSNLSLDSSSMELVNNKFIEYLLDGITASGLEKSIKVAVIGSASEYGQVSFDNLPIAETLIPKPMNLYGITKLDQTKKALAWQKPNNHLVVIRPFNIIGKGMPSSLALGSFSEQINKKLDGDYLQTGNLDTERDFIDVYDVVNLMWRLINNINSYGEVINICSGKPIAMIDVVNNMLKVSGKDIKLNIDQSRGSKNDIKIHYGDNSKLLKLVGEYNFIAWQKTINSMILH
tara:strand:- start:832 stop:1737 length:906 start_codon:yes stop_codon:yes gene_type:complete